MQFRRALGAFSKRLRFALVVLLTTLLTALGGIVLSSAVNAQISPVASAGDATTFNRTSSAYEEAPPNLVEWETVDHDLGDEVFEEAFVSTPGTERSGLGPVFNNVSCVSCHIRNGRGMPEPGQLLLRVTDGEAAAVVDKADALKNAPPVAGLGNQVQDFSIVGETPEAKVEILWKEQAGSYADGTPYRLRSPQFNVTLANGEPLPETVQVSPRIPPHVYGLGLLEAIPEDDILALADPDDVDGDGISGRPNRVWDEQAQEVALGRFGWKANAPNLLQQSADAYVNDMGITSPMFPGEDGSAEIDQEKLVLAAAYAQTLAAPARTLMDDPQVQQGEQLFTDASCVACHVSSFRTGSHKYPALENQDIHPYTDMLLHNMGDALADNRADYEATGKEWRTPSLWGVGLAQAVLPYSGYLHDGRARTFEEAILWHGGEAESSKAAFEAMSAEDRDALVRFLQSL
ncbi:MAG: di-heme oxidoredictase family protein [Cyanobacteria bacterium P01_D01_bin.156]